MGLDFSSYNYFKVLIQDKGELRYMFKASGYKLVFYRNSRLVLLLHHNSRLSTKILATVLIFKMGKP